MENKYVAFTFDDGPVPYAEDCTALRIMKTLQEYGQQATFFYVGQNINEESGKELQFAKSIGCEAGNHTFTHCFLTEKTKEEITEELNKTAAAIKAVLGEEPVLMRLPYLATNETVSATAPYPMIQCSIDSKDWAGVSKEEIMKNVLDAEAAGELENAVVLMHAQYETTANAVSELLPMLMEKGYRFVTVSELAKKNGIVLEPHKLYGKLV